MTRKMELTIILAGGVVEALRLHIATAATESIQSAIKRARATMQPLHPLEANADLQKFFIVDIPDRQSGVKLLEELRTIQGVEGAFEEPKSYLASKQSA